MVAFGNRNKFIYTLICLWIFVLLLGSAYLGIFHYASIRMNENVNISAIAMRYPSENTKNLGSAVAYHIWYADCACSQITAKQLLQQLSGSAVEHVVVLVGSDEQEKLFRAALPGYEERIAALHIKIYHEKDEDKFVKEIGVLGAPSVVVVDAQDKIIYSGGYAPFRPTTTQQITFLELEHKLLSKSAMLNPYPVFGCVMGHQLRKSVDPLHLKQLSRGNG